MLENDLVGVGAGPTNLSLAALIETARARGSIHLPHQLPHLKSRDAGSHGF